MCVVTNRISALLKEQNKRQVALAEALNIPKQTITDWKSGKSKSYFENIPQIANFFGVSCDYLLTGKEYKYTQLITDDEQDLISEYKKLDFKGRSAVMNLIVQEQERMKNEKNSNGNAKIG